MTDKSLGAKPSRAAQIEQRHPAFASYLVQLRRKNRSPRTIESYADCLQVLWQWTVTHRDCVDVLKLSYTDLEAYRVYLASERISVRTGKPISAGAQSYHVAVLRGLFSHCVDERLILRNPAEDLAYPKVRRKMHRDILTPDELMRLIHTPDDDAQGMRDQVALRVMGLSGLRVSEAVALRVEDVNLMERELRVQGKGRRERIAFFDESTQRTIAEYLASTGVVGTLLVADRPDLHHHPPSDGSTPAISRHQLNRLVREYAKRAGIRKRVTAHSLRRTFCSLMLATRAPGVNLKAIAEIVGHRRLDTTARYTQLDIESLTKMYQVTHPQYVNAGPDVAA